MKHGGQAGAEAIRRDGLLVGDELRIACTNSSTRAATAIPSLRKHSDHRSLAAEGLRKTRKPPKCTASAKLLRKGIHDLAAAREAVSQSTRIRASTTSLYSRTITLYPNNVVYQMLAERVHCSA
jgi:hypothetical protein